MKNWKPGAAILIATVATLLNISPGRGDSNLRPGLFASWRIELLAEGKRSEERFAVTVGEEVEENLWRLEVEQGEGGARYEILYRSGGDRAAFDRERIAKVSKLQDGQWRRVDASELSLLDRVHEMETSLAQAEELGDTLVAVGGASTMACRRLRLENEGETVQEGEAVRLRTHWRVSGEVWVSPEVPLGAWVRYREERITKKFSEFSGQVFEGETQTSVTEWTLETLRLP